MDSRTKSRLEDDSSVNEVNEIDKNEINTDSKSKLKTPLRAYTRISSEMRRSVIDSLERGVCSRKSAALTFNLPYGAVTTIYKQFLRTGVVDKKKRTVFKPKALSEEHIQFLLNALAENCTYTLKELVQLMKEKYQINVSTTTINRNIKNFHFTLQSQSHMTMPLVTPELACERKEYCTLYMQLIDCGRMVIYFDETDFNISIRKFAKVKTVNSSLKRRSKTIMASLSNNDLIYYKALDGPRSKEALLEYLSALFDILRKQKIMDAVLIMNNAEEYQYDDLRVFVLRAGHDLVFISRFSPFFNPVDIMFSQWSNLIRSKRPSNDVELEALIDFFSGIMTTRECHNYAQQALHNVSSCLSDTLIFTV